jgi:hypothetical protein
VIEPICLMDGWVGSFTGSDAPAAFPDFDQYRALVA